MCCSTWRPTWCRPCSTRGCAAWPKSQPPRLPAAARASRGLRLLLNNRLAAGGLFVLAVIVLVALAAPLLPLPDPDATEPANRLLPAARGGPPARHRRARPRHPLAADLGHARQPCRSAFRATLIAAFFGSLIGLVAGYVGGRVDTLLMRGIDMLMAFPYILLALAIVAVLGPGLLNALYAIAVVNIPFFARNIRGITLGVSRREFVDAARLSGKSHMPRSCSAKCCPTCCRSSSSPCRPPSAG